MELRCNNRLGNKRLGNKRLGNKTYIIEINRYIHLKAEKPYKR